ncbi:MAG TPA: hypothetical protein VKR38_00720 [Usitatibacter sp.]|nr:hypothetical protein [Usitatibacter sp.]
MEKKRPAAIADWRQVMRPGPRPLAVLLSRGKVVAPPPATPPEPLAKERWEDDGGHFDKVTLPKAPIAGGD